MSEEALDLVYLAHGRPEFTRASFAALRANTNWGLVRQLHIYTDGEPLLAGLIPGFGTHIDLADRIMVSTRLYGGPVAIMQAYLDDRGRADIFAKIDNDTIVPPGWLDAAALVMARHPGIDLLGIEPWQSRTPAPWRGGRRGDDLDRNPTPAEVARGWVKCDTTGGLGLFRTECFTGRSRMRPHSIYGGFQDWQIHAPTVKRAWIVPPLRLFVLDRLQAEPWASLTRAYCAAGCMRPWTPYSASEQEAIAGWWLAQQQDGETEAAVLESRT